MRVFVHLGHGFGAQRWAKRWAEGSIPGVNERLPYGYYHAADDHCVVEYSEDVDEWRLIGLVRTGLRKFLGFDLIHAWRNRPRILLADVVWTHTELEHLAILLLFRRLSYKPRPKLIAQSVWLFDKWQRLSGPRRWLYRLLMGQADVLTVQSPENLKIVRSLFPAVRSELILFGNDVTFMRPPRCGASRRVFRIAALGNDMHRDWITLFAAVNGWEDAEVRIASSRCGPVRRHPANVTVSPARSAKSVMDLYSWADLVVVTLRSNVHASGITVIAEAILFGLPVVCSDTGGLRAYFSEHEVCYVPPGDPVILRRELEALCLSDDRRYGLVERAQARLRNADLNSTARAWRLRCLSEELLAHVPG
jgi:glycosyltransferase involved in cell wall biosynthesis